MIVNYLPLFGVLALAFVFWKNAWISKQEEGDDKMSNIAKNIADGAMSFLKAEYKILSVFVVAVAVLLYFKGSNDYIAQIKDVVSLPILRKEFMIDPLQVIESKTLGADCILIIIGMNSIENNKTIESMALDIGLECVLEVHSLEELEATKHFSSNIIGINNRDLNTFNTDIETTVKLLPNVPKNKTVISESGLSKKSDLERLAKLGVSSFLVGESLMRQEDPEKATKLLMN